MSQDVNVRRLRSARPLAVLGALLIATLVAYLWQVNAAMVRLYELQELTDRRDDAAGRIERLLLRQMALDNPADLAERARQLGLEQPKEILFLKAPVVDVARVDHTGEEPVDKSR